MKFLKDIFINLVAQSLLLMIQQLLLFPHYEAFLGTKDFGIFLTIFGIVNTISIGLGTSFTNLYQRNYNLALANNSYDSEYKKYFYKLIRYFIVCLIPIFLLFSTIYDDILVIILSIILTLIITLRIFLIVKYRVQKRFNIILIFNIILSFSYSLLVFFDNLDIKRVLLYIIIAEIISFFILLFMTKILIINYEKYTFFDKKMLNVLLISGFAGATMTYSDRLLITYLLSGSAVSIFYIATLPSKMLLVPFNMLSSVILSYLADTDVINKKLKKTMSYTMPILCIFIFLISYFVGILIIKLIYPSYLTDIKSIYLIVNISFSLTIFDFVIRSFLVKYFSLKIKAIIDVMALCLFIILSLFFFTIYKNLFSIAFAQLITLLLKVTIEYIIFIRLKEDGKN
ncbi:capsular polysaccharide synthesis protein [Mammaliicoccus fleurettii]|uniref:Polysaccharide biosynthesis protein n=3 Tax=Mammaliicoccus fleurettii TaxID=150056 RepID=A0ABS5MS70_9STAP|nr:MULTISPECIES: hypothetical protein [Mammaliicoccus]HCN61648.1 hypothetical protein [Staphylococcus sp.]MBS3672989.1 hypothetical protein [Mammaliicoccus fleurettii]MBS3698077.1 hypothetical protein [Mammaliicoccus fleurettii]MEB7725164.1 hypothetical protein [Mammaliicoccus fleurettii]SUM37560.1 capsular polysaccharide synthesis protein [Mammaliicoccus fleurettii]